MVQRTFYQDPWNTKKVWEVAKLSHGFYLRQYISGEQFGKGLRASKRFIRDIGILGFSEVPSPKGKNRRTIW